MFELVLIANRGEIARRVARTCRDLGVGVGVVYSDADADALHVRDADLAVRLPGSSATQTYLDIDLVIDAAVRMGADALHPGYGFLAENATLARRCADAGITFIGPSPEAIDAMGSKTEAKRTMAEAGVPLLPSAELGTDDDITALAARVGYPLLIKASAGGGGKAMRIAHGPESLQEDVAACRREALGAFGDDTVFLEHYLTGARHIEIQVFGDHHGQVFHLGERECSVQRRYQKVLEEAPSPAVDAQLRESMGDAAIAAAKAIDYVGAGTVEFMLDGRAEESGRFYFLEMNTRLQVEHPVTEMVTGLDLVRLQLLVAAGERLPAELAGVQINGHAIEARLYAEDVEAGFLPASGTLTRFEIPDRPGLRVDTGVASGSEVSIHYDPLLAKVIAHRDSRGEAAGVLASALRHSCVDGVTSNRDLLVGILREPDYLAGRTTTGYLSDHDPVKLSERGRSHLDTGRPAYLVAAALAVLDRGSATSPVLRAFPAGFRSTPSMAQEFILSDGDTATAVRVLALRGSHQITVDGVRPDLVVHHHDPDLVELSLSGVRRSLKVEFDGERIYVTGPEAVLPLVLRGRFADPQSQVEAGSLTAPMPGTAVRVTAEVGARVAAGDPLVVLEAMKMEHTIRAPGPATVDAVKVAAGDQVNTGDVLVVLDDTLGLDDTTDGSEQP